MLDIKITSNSGFLNYLKGLNGKLDKGLRVARKDIGKLLEKESKLNAPDDEGDLEEAIRYAVRGDKISIFVRRSSKAGKYAYQKHYGKYKRGAGTKSKGSRAGRLFIQRAIDDNESEMDQIIYKAFKKL